MRWPFCLSLLLDGRQSESADVFSIVTDSAKKIFLTNQKDGRATVHLFLVMLGHLFNQLQDWGLRRFVLVVGIHVNLRIAAAAEFNIVGDNLRVGFL